MSLPSPAVNFVLSLFSLFKPSSVSRSVTVWALSFGISIPTVFLPGIGAWIRTSFLASAKAISRFIPRSLESLVPCDNSSSYWITEGPTFTATTSPIIPKSLNVSTSFLELLAIATLSIAFLFFCGESNKSKEGKV